VPLVSWHSLCLHAAKFLSAGASIFCTCIYLYLVCISACWCQRASQLANVLSAAQALVVDDVLSFGPFKLNVSIDAIFEEENFFTLARHDFNAIIGFARRICCVAVLV
jgi:hypothetical protein